MESRVEKAKQLFTDGCNCAQAVAAAYADCFGMSFEDAMRASEAFGGGLGRLRRTCGAVSGMCMLVGLKYSKGQPNDLDTRALIYEKVQYLVKRFEQMNSTSICGDLLGENRPNDNGATPTTRNNEFYQKRPCIGCVEDCARLVEEVLLCD